jgi:hypothetical protein
MFIYFFIKIVNKHTTIKEENMKRIQETVIIFILIMLINPIAWRISSAAPLQDAIFFIHDKDGLTTVHKPGLPWNGGGSNLRSPFIVWSHYLTDAIYQTTANAVNGYVFAGTYLNPPKEAQLFALSGGGDPEWGYPGTEFYTDASDTNFTLAAVDDTVTGVDIYKWTCPGTGVPDWSTNVAGFTAGSDGTIAVSDDGSTIAVLAGDSANDAHLLLFDADSSTPLIDYPATGLGFARYLKMTPDGRYTAFIALATLIVFDRDSLSVRAQISMGFSNSALDISGDGNLIAYGWPTLQVRQWSGSSYQSLWTWSPGGMYVNRIAISNDGSTIVSCWYNLSFNTIKIAVHDTSSSTPLWTYDYVVSNGTYQEIAGDVEITDDGTYFVVGSLGDIENLNPEVHIFQRDNVPHVYYTVDMPGSMFSVDICNDGLYATACGKHIHANAMGRGGDIVMINTDLTAVSENNPGNIPNANCFINANPNPFRTRTVISYYLPVATNVRLEIFDLSGAKITTLLNENQIAGYKYIAWSGLGSDNKHSPDGVYFVRLTTDDGFRTTRLVLVR